MSVVVVSEPSQPPPRGCLTAAPERVEAVDPHRHCLEPFFDVVALAIDEKLVGDDVVFLGETMDERRLRISSAVAVDVDL